MAGKKSKKNKRPPKEVKARELNFAEDQQEYAKVLTLLGDRKLNVKLPDMTETMAVIPGRMRRRCWISVDNVILISFRDFQDGKVDVIHKFTDDEVKNLVNYSEIPDWFSKPSSMISESGGPDQQTQDGFTWKAEGESDTEIDIDDI